MKLEKNNVTRVIMEGECLMVLENPISNQDTYLDTDSLKEMPKKKIYKNISITRKFIT